MDEVGIEPTSSIGDALAMRPLRPTPAGIGLPLAELILGKGISLSAESDQDSVLDLRFFKKNRVKLLVYDRTHIVRNFGARSALA